MSLRELLAGPPVVLDGALATELEARGFDLSDALWSARLLADDPEAIEAVHRAYLEAGAQVLITASYQASVEGFTAQGHNEQEAEALLRRSVELAQRARGTRAALVAASVGPYGAVLAGGEEYSGDYGALTDGELEAFHERRLRVLLAAGPDCVACETIPRVSEAAALVRVLDRLDAPDAWISFSCRDGRTTSHGEPIEEAVGVASAGRSVVAVGVNCTAPEHIEELLTRARTATDLPLVAYPNNGRVWDGAARCWTDAGASILPAGTVRAWVDAGACLVGGCCGLGPDAVRALAGAYGAPATVTGSSPSA
jgi:homocysteine S-methyltransferase